MNNESKQEFTILVEKHAGILHKVVRMYCSSPADREDLAQDIYHQLWKSFRSYDPAYRFSTWMYRVALNTAISAYRKKSRYEFEEYSDENTSNETEENLLFDDLMKEINRLDPLDKGLILMQLEKCTHTEIAEVFGISVSNVGTRLSRIKNQLKRKFQHQNNS
jgi:RNA polymerase sigma-70 factor (ECF subfamily)